MGGNHDRSAGSLDIPARISAVMAIDPLAPAVEYDECWFTWGDLVRVGSALETRLASLAPSAPVAVVTRNRPSAVAAILSLLARRRPVLLLNGMHPDAALAAELDSLCPALVVAGGEEWERNGLRAAVADCGALGLTVADDLTGVEVAVAGDVDRADALQTLGDDVALSLQTSGTTGPPKRIEMTYANLSASIQGVTRHYTGRELGDVKLRPGVVIQMLPLGHTSALLSLTMMAIEGRRMTLLDRFEPRKWAQAVHKHQVAVSGLPPAAIASVLDAEIPPVLLSSLKAVRAGTAPLDPSVAEEFTKAYDIPVIQAYGATEFQGVASWSLGDFKTYGAVKSGSVGRAHPGVELRTVDPESGTPLGHDQTGVLEVRSAQSAGNRAEEWVRTSDLARVDADGFLWILGRVDDVINRGGFKVDAGTVANVLREHPLVKDAVVVGAPDRRLGSVPVALVESSAVEELSEDELRTWVRDRLEAPQVPVRVGIVPALPRNGTMKVPVPDVLAALDLSVPEHSAP